MSDYWVVARKNGHRRFFVLITQKDVNFAEVNGTYGKNHYVFRLLHFSSFIFRGSQEDMSERVQ